MLSDRARAGCGGAEVKTMANSIPLWLREFRAAKYPQQNQMPSLDQIEIREWGLYPNAEEQRVGLTFRETGAGNVVATDLASGLTLKASTWQDALRGLAGNCGALNYLAENHPEVAANVIATTVSRG